MKEMSALLLTFGFEVSHLPVLFCLDCLSKEEAVFVCFRVRFDVRNVISLYYTFPVQSSAL